MLNKIKIILLIFTSIILIHHSNCQLKNCSKFIEILYDEKQSWIGNLTLISPERLNGVSIEMIFDEPIKSLSTDFGRTSTTNRMNFIIKDEKFILEPDSSMSVVFEVRYGKNSRIPSIKSLKLNENLKCSNDEIAVKEAPTETPQKIETITEVAENLTEIPTTTTTTTTTTTLSTSSEIPTTDKPQENKMRIQKSKFTIPLSELKNNKLIRIVFDRNVLSLMSDIGDGETSNNKTFEINIEDFDTDLYEFEKKQDNPGVEFYFSYNINDGIPKIADLMYIEKEVVILKTKTNDTMPQDAADCFYVDSREIFSDTKIQEWSYSIEIPSDLLLDSNSFEVTFDRSIRSLSSSKGNVEKRSSRKFVIYCNLEEEIREGKYVSLIFTTQSKSNCEEPKLVEFSINRKPYCLAILELSENENSNSTGKIKNAEVTHYGSDCLQLTEIIDNQGNWDASLRIPPADSPNGVKVFLLFDKDVLNIQSNYGEVSTEDNISYMITGFTSRTVDDGPLIINMTLTYLIQNGFPEFANVMVDNTVYCITRAKLITYSPAFTSSFMNQHNKVESDSQRCIKYIEMISDDGYWNATLLVPPFESYSGSQIQMVFDRNLIALTSDFAETYTFDYKTFILYNTIPRRFQDGPLEIKLNFIYDGYQGLPDLLRVFLNSLPTCVDRTLLSSSDFENNPVSSTTALPSTTPTTTSRTTTLRTTDSNVDSKQFTTESYFDIVSSKYNPGNANRSTSIIENKENNPPANTGSDNSPIIFPSTSTVDQGCVYKILLAENPSETQKSGLGQKNVYLHLHFPSTPLNFDDYVSDNDGHKHLFLGPHPYSPFGNYEKLGSPSETNSQQTFVQPPIEFYQRDSFQSSQNKKNVPSIESLKNLGKQNTFYNYFGDSQYITYAIPPHGHDQSPSFDDLIVANLRSSRTKNQKKKENLEATEQQSRNTQHSAGNSEVTSNKKKKGFFMPKLALFVKSSELSNQ